MKNYDDEIGKVYGTLKVIKVFREKTPNDGWRWFAGCECSCGAVGKTYMKYIKTGHSSSCIKFKNKAIHRDDNVTEIYFHTGEIALIDTEDYCLFDKSRLTVNISLGYSVAYVDGVRDYTHRHILRRHGNLPAIVDHININKLDNRKINLRDATQSINMHNCYPRENHSSVFKGVQKRINKNSIKWSSEIRHNNKIYRIGTFSSDLKAAKAYDEKAMELYGALATTNRSLGLL